MVFVHALYKLSDLRRKIPRRLVQDFQYNIDINEMVLWVFDDFPIPFVSFWWRNGGRGEGGRS